MAFAICQSEKTPFYAIKTRSSKSRYIEIFPKGLTHSFGPKMASISTFFFQVLQARKMSFTIFQCEKTPFQDIKTESSKSRNIDLFPDWLTHGFGPKMTSFPTFCFYAIQARKIPFIIFQSEKTSFQATKIRSSRGRKIDIFPKRLTLGFVSKMVRFPTFFFFTQYRPRK